MSTAVATVAPTASYLVRAIEALDNLGLKVREPNSAPIAALIRNVSEIDETRAIIIARTIAQQEVFDTVVAEQVSGVTVGQRYERIAQDFDSIRDDAKRMVDQLSDGKISLGERISNIVMKVTRGDIADRFDNIRKVHLEVTEDTRRQIEREEVILESYRQFRGALKEAEVLAYEILEQAERRLDQAKEILDAAVKAVEESAGASNAERARLELERDAALHAYQKEDDRYQVAKDLADNLRVSYNTTEVVMARLVQTHEAKRRLWQQAVVFFKTNTTVLSALKASFTGLAGLHETTQTIEAMKDGLSTSLETLAELGGKVQEAAVRTGYGATIRAESVRKVVDSVVQFQERVAEIIREERQHATANANEIRESVEAGKRRLANLLARGERIG